ncbi:MAG: ATP-binding protein [Gallionellaceae bacterium]|jgi:PAS domain S-box-containing protein
MRPILKALHQWQQHSLANSITLQASVIAIGSALLIALISLSVLFWTQNISLHTQLQEKAGRSADRIERVINITETTSADLAKSPIFTTAIMDTAGRNSFVDPFLKNFTLPIPAANGIALCDINGMRLAATRTAGMSDCRASSPLFKQVLKDGIVARELIKQPDGHLSWVIYRGVIFAYTGTVEGIVVTQLDLHDLFLPLLSDLDLKSIALVNNAENLVLVGRPDITASDLAFARKSVFSNALYSPFTRLEIVIWRNLSYFEGALLPLLLSYFLGILLLVIGVAYWVRHAALNLIEPLTKLTNITREIALTGDMHLKIPAYQSGELGSLTKAFQNMVGKIREGETQLENQVVERTRQLQSTEASLRSVLNAATSVAIIATDTQGNITLFNSGAERMLGYSAAQVIKQMTFTQFHLPQELSARAERQKYTGTSLSNTMEFLWQQSATHVQDSTEWTWLRQDGKSLVINLSVTKIINENNGLSGYLGVAEDITLSKDYEDELLRSNIELEQFSFAVSHDMRQPLRMIASYLQLIEMGLADKLNEEQHSYFNFAVEGAKRIDHMLVALLEYSRIGRKGEPAKWIESRDILDEALKFLQPVITEARAEIKIDGNFPRILAGQDEILRLLQNLIGNAVKYRIADRTPEIIITSKVLGNEWQVCIADNGVGIIPDQIKRLFKVFQRLQTRQAYEGTGIGLALSRKIVEHHKGRIWAESDGEGQGSRFYFAIPLRQDSKHVSQ